MPETVPRLCRIFTYKVVRCVAIVAGRNRLVARFEPAAVLIVHYVAIDAHARVVAHVRVTLAVPKRIGPNSDGESEADAKNDKFQHVDRHAEHL